MIKEFLVKIFYGMGIITISGIVWGFVIGFVPADNNNTEQTGVFPSVFNRAVYSNALPIISDRVYTELDGSGVGYTERTYRAYMADITDKPMYSTYTGGVDGE